MKERGSQEKGEARIQELMEMFPEIPRLEVVVADYRREGLRHTAILDEIGRWAWPQAHAYYEFDYDEHKKEDLEGGVSRTPAQIYFGKNTSCYIQLDARSPYEVKYEGGGRYWLYREGDPIEQVYFLPCPQWFWKKTSSGKPMNLVVNSILREQPFNTFVTTYCEYFKDGDQCLFCNLNPTVEHFTELGQERMWVKREQDIYETCMAYAPEMKTNSLVLIGGGFHNRSKEADLYLRTLEVLKRAMRDSRRQVESITLCLQAMEEEDLRRLKEAGVTNLQCNMEVWDPKLFEIFCPGKAKYVGRERWIECLLRAVEVFGGRGQMYTNFVIGVEQVPPFGFKTEEEAAESVLEGFRYMASHGVALQIQIFRGRPGADLVQAPSPRTEYFLRMELEGYKLHKEYNLRDPSAFHPKGGVPVWGGTLGDSPSGHIWK